MGSPEEYANGKAVLFPNEGGPAILEMEVPLEIVRLGIEQDGEIRFIPGYGIQELLQAWPSLPKRII